MPDLGAEALRIALLTHSVNPRGGVVHTLELARALHDLGHHVTVFAPAQAGQRLFRTVPHAVELVPVGPAPENLADMVGERIDALVSHFSQTLQHRQFDIFHTHDGIGGNALATLAEAGVIGGFVRTVHHLDTFADPRLAAWQGRAVLRAQTVLCVSQGWCDTLRREWHIEPLLVANGVDTGRYHRAGRTDPAQRSADPRDAQLAQRLGLRPGAPLLLSVGGIEARKNTLGLLDAFVQLRNTHPNAQWVVAGGASLLDHSAYGQAFAERLRASALANAAAPGLEQALVFTGTLPDEDMPALFRLADVMAMPSLNEGFGLVVLEALACGTPVVVSQIAPFTEYLGDTVAAGHAVYADPHVPASIAEALRTALQPQRRAALLQATPPVCLAHRWPASAQRHVAIYKASRALGRAAWDRASPPARADALAH